MKTNLVYLHFPTHIDKMYFHFWKGGSVNWKAISFSNMFPNNRPPLNEWYKLQLIQSTHDGKSCRQELKINDRSVWEKRLACPYLKTGVQHIYTGEKPDDHSKTLIKNFKFFSHPLSN